MNGKYFFLFVSFFTFISAGYALNCYVCSGSPTSDCAKGVVGSMGARDCHVPRIPFYLIDDDMEDEDGGRLESVCLKFTLTNYQPNLVVRNCGVFRRGVDPCTFLKRKLRIANCASCSSDKCNVKSDVENDISVSYLKAAV